MTRILELLFQESGDPGRVKSKANKSGKLRSRAGKRSSRDSASGVASGSSEVMVKISGYGNGGAHAKAHLMYITRHAMADKEKIAIENDKGQLFDNVDDVKQLYEDWSRDIDANKKPGHSKNQRDTMHMILSMPGKNNPGLLRDAVRDFAADAFGHNHEYVFALHTDTDNDHCHLAVKCRGFNGRQLHVPKGQVQQWRQDFAERLRERGIDAEATPRNMRGVVRKPEKQVLRHIDDPEPPKGRAPRQSRVMKSRLQEAEAAMQGEGPDRPWEAAVRASQGRTKATWLRAAQDLETRPTALKTTDGKELKNARIDYGRIDPAAARAGQRRGAAVAGIDPGRERRADLYQPGGIEPVHRGPARPVPGLRDVPLGNVARDQGRAAVLLREDARHSVEGGRHADFEMRRPRAGAVADAAARGAGGGLSLADRNQMLASQIRRFVATMPEPITAHEALQRQIRSQVDAARRVLPRVVEPQDMAHRAVAAEHNQGGQDAGKDNGRSR